MIELDVFLPNITPYAPGCAEPTAFAAIIKAAQTFCERTRLWRGSSVLQVTPAGPNLVTVPVGSELFEIESARFDGRELQPISLSDLDNYHPRWRDLDNGAARWITQTEPGSVQLVPASTGALSLSTLLRPIDHAEQLPDLFSQYTQMIADGALADILMLPAQSYSDPQRAQFYAQRFDNRIDSLCKLTIQGQQRAPVRSRARFF
jgi:hypothetical protein